ncbi:hypothetical protein U1Q18_019917 [Sarracenia purpurea var. burkii]
MVGRLMMRAGSQTQPRKKRIFVVRKGLLVAATFDGNSLQLSGDTNPRKSTLGITFDSASFQLRIFSQLYGPLLGRSKKKKTPERGSRTLADTGTARTRLADHWVSLAYHRRTQSDLCRHLNEEVELSRTSNGVIELLADH